MHVLLPFLLVFSYACLAKVVSFPFNKEAYFLAYCFSLIYLARTAYLWLVLPKPSTNLSKTAYILFTVNSSLSFLEISSIILALYSS